MKHALQYNFIALFIQEWITTDYNCVANTVLLSKLHTAHASMGICIEIHRMGPDGKRKTAIFIVLTMEN